MAFDSALKMTKVKLDLFSDEDKYSFIEKAIRGGIAMITKRKVTANNKYLKDGSYDPSKESSFLFYIDANNLYGQSMSQPLPTGMMLIVARRLPMIPRNFQ